MVSGSGRLLRRAGRHASALILTLGLWTLLGCEQAVETEEPVIRPVRSDRVAVAGGLERRIYSGSVRAERETDG